jgi:hypothetical protein
MALGLFLALCVLTVLTIGKPAGAVEGEGLMPGPDVEPTLITHDNPTCADLGYEHEFKVDPPIQGETTYDLPGGNTVTVTINGLFVDWKSTLGMDAVIVKGGDNANSYVYDPPAESTEDDGLHAPDNASGGPAGLSHINFCYDGETVAPKPLTATKTANGSYDRTITWDLTKTVDDNYHSGLAGDSFNSIWTVTATKNDQALSNFNVAGDITIKNPNGFPVNFSVTDELDDTTVADVDCDPNTEGNQDSGTVPAKVDTTDGSATCTYSASPPIKSATLNTAHVTTSNTDGVEGTKAEKTITWTENVKGDNSVTLADPRFTYSELISGNTTKTFPETFTCPTDRASYDANRSYTKTFTNTATLKGDNTDKTASATVTLKCTYPWVSETATGFGDKYTGTSNWFMVTKFPTPTDPQVVNLIAGQKYDAGDITFTRNGTTTIKIALDANNFRFANVANNLKIKNFSTAQPQYVAPGSFPYKFNCSQALSTCTATGLPNAAYYGIHVDVERKLP